MKYTIEVEDFWLDSESDLEPSLCNHITREVVNQIWKKIEDKVDSQITKIVGKAIEESLQARIEDKVSKTVESGEVILNNGTSGKIENYVLEKFDRHAKGWASANKKIEELAGEYAKEMKNRYDLLFASQIVSKMKDNGFLDKDVADKLLSEGK